MKLFNLYKNIFWGQSMNILKLAIPALLSSLCNASANALWKTQLSMRPMNTESITSFFASILNVRIIGGAAFYGVSMLLFFYILSNFRLSQAIPFLATTYVFNFIIAALCFHETFVMNQIIGITLIIGGVIISNIT